MSESKCFAELDRGKCAILTIKQCQGHEKCSMFKTEEQAEIDREKAFERIASLPHEKQIRISDKHYNGTTPWIRVKRT